LLTDLGGESKEKTTKVSSIYPPPNPKEKGPEIAPKNHQEKALKFTKKNEREQHI
jgi:hypothetical protein